MPIEPSRALSWGQPFHNVLDDCAIGDGDIDSSSQAQDINHPAPVILSGAHFQQRILDGLVKISADPHVLYMTTLRQRTNAEQVNQWMTQTVKAYGFARPSDFEYIYQGPDPAQALDQLSQLRPLVLDCLTALRLLMYQELLAHLGPSDFNRYIQEAHQGKLAICQQTPSLPSNSTVYYTARHEQNENPLPHGLQSGDRLWIQGPAQGYAFHPTSDVNAFNVLVDTHTTPQNPR